MEIQRAETADLDDIEKIYDRIHDAEEQGQCTVGWIRAVYPTRKTAEDALNRKDLFAMKENGQLVATAIINQIQVAEYQKVTWKQRVKEDAVMVLHCLAVDPAQMRNGYGKAFIAFYETYARQCGCTALRMDTNAKNTRARKLYQTLSYEEVGIVPCVFNGIPNVQLVCLEKDIR